MDSKKIDEKIKELESNDRMKGPPALADVNAPLALIQCSIEGKIAGLKFTRELLLAGGRK